MRTESSGHACAAGSISNYNESVWHMTRCCTNCFVTNLSRERTSNAVSNLGNRQSSPLKWFTKKLSILCARIIGLPWRPPKRKCQSKRLVQLIALSLKACWSISRQIAIANEYAHIDAKPCLHQVPMFKVQSHADSKVTAHSCYTCMTVPCSIPSQQERSPSRSYVVFPQIAATKLKAHNMSLDPFKRMSLYPSTGSKGPKPAQSHWTPFR